MEFEVEIIRGGITFLVKGCCDCEGIIDLIDKVCVYKGKKAYEVDFDRDDFVSEFEDDLYEAIDEHRRTEAICAAEDRMDARREEGWCK